LCAGGGGCPYNNQSRIEVLRDEAILAIHDIEELVEVGRKSNSCPYYASRLTIFNFLKFAYLRSVSRRKG
jgi:hypothetical protein